MGGGQRNLEASIAGLCKMGNEQRWAGLARDREQQPLA